MDYQTARNVLDTKLVKSFSRTYYENANLRRSSILWAINLPKGINYENRIETIYYKTYTGSVIKFGKPGKESKRRKPNPWDMKPTLYEMRNGKLRFTEKGFNFSEMLIDIRTKISKDEKAGHVLMSLFYRSGILKDHSYRDNVFSYNPNTEVIKWLDKRYEGIGEIPPSELIPMYDAIMFNDDVKVYLNNEKYNTRSIEPYGPRGRVNTMGAIFAICAPENLLSRIELSDMLIRGRGTPRIFSKYYDYGGKLILPMTGGIIHK